MVTPISCCRPDKFVEHNDGILCKLVKLNLVSLQHLNHEVVAWKAKSDNKECLKDHDFASRLMRSLSTNNTTRSCWEITQTLHFPHLALQQSGPPSSKVSPPGTDEVSLTSPAGDGVVSFELDSVAPLSGGNSMGSGGDDGENYATRLAMPT
jgi:hypothetical protein